MACNDKRELHTNLSVSNLLHDSQRANSGCRTFEVGERPSDRAPRTILDEAADRNIAIRSDCGGKGLCGKCLVLASPGDHLSALADTESRLLSPEERAEGYRLACQAMILGPVRVTAAISGSPTLEDLGKSRIHGSYPADPAVKRIVLPHSLERDEMVPGVRDRTGQAEASIEKLTGKQMIFRDLHPVCELSRISLSQEPLTFTWHEEKGITAVVAGIRNRSLGVALDIGTTTVAAYLCDLVTGAVLTAAATTNPQRRYGEDVVSRIAFAREASDGSGRLQKMITEEVNALIGRCLDKVGAIREDVDEMVVVGNTTMQHLFAGIDPQSLGFFPYLPARCDPLDLRAADIGIEISPATNVHVFPVISGFIGGDTLGAIIAEAPHQDEAVSLIVDLGTNGEIVLGNRAGLWASSCAMGPAFEGAHISSGRRAAFGAIHKVQINPATGRVHYEVLGGPGTPPRGICGSGIIDAVAAMRRGGALLSNGRIEAGRPGVKTDGGDRRFILAPGEETADGREIALTQSDIRQVQLAKAAMAVGIDFLMRLAGAAQIDRMVLTGAFGVRFDWRNAVDLGMLPAPAQSTEVAGVENAAGVGAIMALLNKKRRTEAQRLSSQVRFLDLAKEPGFAEAFSAALTFPPINKDQADRA